MPFMSDTIDFLLVDAFAHSPYSGNVAGVVPSADGLTDRQMQGIASEFNAAETAYVLKPTTADAAIRIRWFTPGCEVDFCGHATLAAVHALIEADRFSDILEMPGTLLPIETRSGIVTVQVAVGQFGGDPLPEQLVAQLQRLGQLVDLGARVVETERGPAGRRHAETGHQRLCAVVPGAHRHALAVDHRRDVVGVRFRSGQWQAAPG